MFFDSGSDEAFLIDRVSAGGRELRRVLVLSDVNLYVCKLDGSVTRIIPIEKITHLIFGTANGVRGGIVLLRSENSRDLLFTHSSVGQLSLAKQAAAVVERIAELRKTSASVTPLTIIERNDESLIRSAADLARRYDSQERPKSFPVLDQVLVPILFENIAIPAEAPLVREALDLFVDATFVNMLHRAVSLHPMSAFEAPLVSIEAPPPFRPLEVSSRFFSGFCRAYDESLPLVINVHSHLPNITSFRASKQFWVLVQRLLKVSRPITSVMNALASDHVEAYVVGEEQFAVTCTVKEWNDVIIQWEMSVRDPEANAKGFGSGKLSLASKDSDVYWQTFVTELERGLA